MFFFEKNDCCVIAQAASFSKKFVIVVFDIVIFKLCFSCLAFSSFNCLSTRPLGHKSPKAISHKVNFFIGARNGKLLFSSEPDPINKIAA